MALILKKGYEGYFYLLNDVADPRSEELLFMQSPIPTILILFLWFKFIYNWGPEFMKNREPFNLKYIMIVYNIFQVFTNCVIVYYAVLARNVVNWRCAEVDYSNSYWGLKFVHFGHVYYLLKIADLLDTMFFVLRKKQTHVSFLHVYHHLGMVVCSWVGAKFVSGGHSYFIVFANAFVHAVLYSYYLLTAYDGKYSKLIWLKKFITQIQLLQFLFLLIVFGQLLFLPDCNYPKFVTFLFIPQNLFMIILFGDFYIRTYYLAPRRKKNELEKKPQGSQEKRAETY